jgi:arylsulfatase A-like enzyme
MPRPGAERSSAVAPTPRARRWTGALLAPLLHSLFLGCTAGSHEASNLLLISLDTTSMRRLSTYGAERETSPAITALANRGVLFRNAYSVSPWTMPAHASMLTGRYPSSLTPDPNDPRLYRAGPLVPQLFRDRGYRTGAVTGGFYNSARHGMHRGFDSFQEAHVEEAVEWLEAHHAEPFFLFFHTYVAHEPYTDRRFTEGHEGGRLANLYLSPKEKAISNQVKFGGIDPTAEERDFVLALYDGGIAAADGMVGELVAALERLDAMRNTVVVVTSDHGEEFWEHTGRGAYHGHTLYDELLRIPLVWFDPALDGVPRIVDEAVSLVDLVPTFVARFDLAPRSQFDGLDLGPLLRGQDWNIERSLFAEAVRNGPGRWSVRTPQGILIEVPDATIQNGGVLGPIPVLAREELYLPADTAQLKNLAQKRPELLDRLKLLLDEHQRGGARIDPPVPIEALDDEERRKLEAIGYLE